jgi:hypothetical protein
MFKWIFLTQAIIYLLIMPFMHRSGVLGYYPSIGASLLAIISLCLGYLIQNFAKPVPLERYEKYDSVDLEPKPYLPIAILSLAILYCVTVLSFGLFNRRQGSEFMADLFAGLPIYALAIIRIYEILLIPILVLYLFGKSASKRQKYVVFSAILLSLPFTGIADSRSRLLLIAIYLTCFVPPKTFASFVTKYSRFYLAGFAVVGAFLFYSAQRVKGYNSLNEYLLFEVYQRLDGMNLVTDLRDSGFISKFGSFDTEMFAPLISKIPFLEAAHEAKLMGQTSTKQYYLQSLLGRSQLDTPNSMIADPLYFAGWAGVVLAFLMLGYAIGRFDRFIISQRIMASRHKLALAIAFVTSFALIENDMVASITVLIQNYLFILALLLFGTNYTILKQRSADENY